MKLKYQSSRLFNVFTLIILTALCFLLNSLTQIDFHHLELPKNKPEFLAKIFTANLYTPTGQRLYQVTAESGLQFPATNRIDLTKLKLQSFESATGALAQELTSNDGWLDPKTTLAFLGESVAITVMNKNPEQIIHIFTRQVYIDGTTKVAKSAAPLLARQGKSVLTGIGFTVDYSKQLLTIESAVKIIYIAEKGN